MQNCIPILSEILTPDIDNETKDDIEEGSLINQLIQNLRSFDILPIIAQVNNSTFDNDKKAELIDKLNSRLQR